MNILQVQQISIKFSLIFNLVDEFEANFSQFFKQSRPISGPAVVTEIQFFYQFDIFTYGLFRGLFSWENTIIIGGAVLGNSLPENKK